MLGEKQREEEIEKMKEAFSQLLQDAASRSRKEVSHAYILVHAIYFACRIQHQ